MHDIFNAVLSLLYVDLKQICASIDHVINDLLAFVDGLDGLSEFVVSGLPFFLLLQAFPLSNVHGLLSLINKRVGIDDVLLKELLLWDKGVLKFMIANTDTDLCLTLPLLDSILDGIVISQSNSVIILFGLDLEAQVIIHVLKRCDEFIQWPTGR